MLRIRLLLPLAFLISGCTVSTDEGSAADRALRWLSDGGSVSRERVITDFAADPKGATIKYKLYWEAADPAAVPVSDPRRVVLTAVAGELANSDESLRGEYLQFMFDSASSPSDDVASSAAWALSNPGDAESLEVLISMLSDPREGVRGAAIGALKLRHGETLLEPSAAEAVAAIELAVQEFCEQPSRHADVDRFCDVPLK